MEIWKAIRLGGITLFLVLCMAVTSQAQLNSQVNQYMVYQPFINYAAAASYQTTNGAVFYRNQWTGFSGAPVNYGVAASFPMYKSMFGIQAFSDNIGVHSNTTLALNYAYRINIERKSFLSFSLSPEIRFLSAKYSQVSTNDINDPILSYDTKSYALPNFKAGIYYFKKNLYLGFAATNLLYNNATTTNFTDSYQTGFKLSEVGWLVHGGYRFDLENKNGITISTLIKESKGAALHADINSMYYFSKSKIGIGASYRTTGDIVGILNIQFAKMLKLSYAYQADLGGLQAYQSGSHELMLIYEVPAKKKKKFVTIYCPRF